MKYCNAAYGPGLSNPKQQKDTFLQLLHKDQYTVFFMNFKDIHMITLHTHTYKTLIQIYISV